MVLPISYPPGVVVDAVADTGERMTDCALAFRGSNESAEMPKMDRLVVMTSRSIAGNANEVIR
jgi:hypothetical protein